MPNWTEWAGEGKSEAVFDRRLSGAAAYAGRAPSLVAIGNFDGVHRGHRAVLATAAAEAAARGLTPIVLTFHPHPAVVLGRGTLPVLTVLERKLALLLRLDPAWLTVVQPFSQELARLSPEEFATNVLAAELNARLVIVGENFRFGHNRAGDLETLRSLGRELGFEARVEPLASDSEGPFSSTRVREALKVADLASAERCLGRPHSISGRVTHGNARGRTIGFPTANLSDVAEALPPKGVYACLVDRADEEGGGVKLGRGVVNIGDRPTLGAGFAVEVHLFDFQEDLYGQLLRVHLIERLREERRFADLTALKQQITLDSAEARRILASRSMDPEAGGAWA